MWMIFNDFTVIFQRFYSEAIDFIREHLEYVHLFNIEEELESIIVNEGK